MARGLIGIRLEDKNKWECRAPIAPHQMGRLIREKGIKFAIQPSPIRVFPDQDYRKEGAEVSADLSSCNAILAVKEIPMKLFQPHGTYMFFAHVIKGQSYNMPMLKKLMELKCQLIDYEKVVDAAGKRTIFFSRHAGIAGIIETLWALGKRLKAEGIEDKDNVFLTFKQAFEYGDLETSKNAFKTIARLIKEKGTPAALKDPFVIGITGYGNVSKGVQELLDLLPIEDVIPSKLQNLHQEKSQKRDRIYKVVFKEEHMVRPKLKNHAFDLNEYYQKPELYEGCFTQYLPHITVLVNAIYWDVKYPRVVTKTDIAELYKRTSKAHCPNLRVIGDISCDIDGGIEFMSEATKPDHPVYVYDPRTDKIEYGVENLNGPVVMAIDNLPCEIAKDSTEHFGESLFDFIPALANADYSVPFQQLDLPDPIKGALIVHHGELTEKYKYLQKYL